MGVWLCRWWLKTLPILPAPGNSVNSRNMLLFRSASNERHSIDFFFLSPRCAHTVHTEFDWKKNCLIYIACASLAPFLKNQNPNKYMENIFSFIFTSESFPFSTSATSVKRFGINVSIR